MSCEAKKRVQDARSEAVQRVQNATAAAMRKIEVMAEEAVAIVMKRRRVLGLGESR